MTGKLLEPQLYNEAPSKCTKPGCEGTLFIPHEDGWQCFNCMKIIYKVSEGSKPEPLINKIRKSNPKTSLRFGYIDV